jgi:hypothetical protein
VETYKDQNLQGKSFILENVVFLKCKLSDCDLYYSGGDFEWAETFFENCRFHWRGPAKNTLALLQVMGMTPAPTPPKNSGIPGQKVN